MWSTKRNVNQCGLPKETLTNVVYQQLKCLPKNVQCGLPKETLTNVVYQKKRLPKETLKSMWSTKRNVNQCGLPKETLTNVVYQKKR